MIRLATVVWLALVACAGFGMFEVKYAVMDLEETLAKTNRAIDADEDAIHVLKAEWSYLTQPSRLTELSRKYLDLKPMGTAQLGQLETLPTRPAALPPETVASTTLPTPASGSSRAPSHAPAPPASTTKPASPTRLAAAKPN